MITAPAIYSLDYLVRPRDLARHLRPLWSIPWSYSPVHTRLYHWGEALLMAQPGEGLVEIGPTRATETWTRWSINLSSVGPGWYSEPVAISRSGVIVRVEEGGKSRPVIDARVAGETIAAIGLPNNLVLLKRYEGSGASFELWSDRCLWRREGSAHWIVPHDKSLLWLRNQTLDAVDLMTGHTTWSAALPVSGVAGILEDLVWLRGNARLFGLDLASGGVRHDVALADNRAAEGIMDEAGRYHSTTGIRYQIYDFSKHGALAADYALSDLGTAPGDLLRLVRDGRILFSTDYGKFSLFDPKSPSTLIKAAAFPPPVPQFGIAHKALWVIALGELRCYGDASNSLEG
jgi:hypothetical protein